MLLIFRVDDLCLSAVAGPSSGEVAWSVLQRNGSRESHSDSGETLGHAHPTH